MGINIRNNIRKVNAKLGSGTVIGYGNHWSLVDELDGWNKVYVGTPNLPNNIKEYLEGNPTLSVYATPQNIDKLHQYAFAGFPNLVDLYLLKEEEIVELDDNFLGGVNGLQHIYVPSDLLGDSSTQDTYLGEYNGKTFASLFTAIPNVLEWTITPNEIGSDTLNEENFNAYISTLTDRIKNAVGQLNLNEFTNGVDFAWSYDFSNVFPSLEDIYVDNVKVDFSVWTIQGSGTLTSEIVESSIASITSDKLSGITKVVVPDTFYYDAYISTSAGALDPAINNLPNLEDIEVNYNKTYSVWRFRDIATYFTNSSSTKKYNLKLNISTPTNMYFNFYDNDQTITYGINKLLLYSPIVNFNSYSSSPINVRYCELIEGTKTFNLGRGTITNKLILPSSITSIGDVGFRFGNNSRSCKVYLNMPNVVSVNPPYWNAGIYYFGYGYLKFYVPSNIIENYLSDTQWSIVGTSGYIGFIDYTDTVPTWTDYSATWYSDEDCTTEILPANFVSGNRYFVKLLWNNPTLTIEPKEGETTLTSAIVTRELAKASSNYSVVTKVVIDSGFTSIDSKSVWDSALNNLPNWNTLELTISNTGAWGTKLPSTFLEENNKIKTYINHSTTIPENGLFYNLYVETIIYDNLTTTTNGFNIKSKNIIANNVVSNAASYPMGNVGNSWNTERIEFKSCTNINQIKRTYGMKYLYLGDVSSLSIENGAGIFATGFHIYFPANVLEGKYTNISTYAQYFAGYHTYNNDLPTFTNYTAIWYEDEDFTTPILEADMVIGTEYYCLLTAI